MGVKEATCRGERRGEEGVTDSGTLVASSSPCAVCAVSSLSRSSPPLFWGLCLPNLNAGEPSKCEQGSGQAAKRSCLAPLPACISTESLKNTARHTLYSSFLSSMLQQSTMSLVFTSA